jgi:hypothetical protein
MRPPHSPNESPTERFDCKLEITGCLDGNAICHHDAVTNLYLCLRRCVVEIHSAACLDADDGSG